MQLIDMIAAVGTIICNGESRDKVLPWNEWIGLLGRPRSPEFIKIYEDTFNNILQGEVLLIPISSRTVASPTGKSDYAFERIGGWSMIPPYLAGVYALACQVKPDITPELFWQIALQTGEKRTIHKGDREFLGRIINPVGLIESLEKISNMSAKANNIYEGTSV